MSPATIRSGVIENGSKDTIVVKSNDTDWAHQPSHESTPEVEPVGTNLLASIDDPKNRLLALESPEPDDELDMMQIEAASNRPRSDAGTQHSSKPSLKPRQLAGTSEERLLLMPELRPLPWREGVDPASENLVGGDSRRKQIRYGCLLATRGQIQKVPCTTCANGRGKFSVCVALDNFFKGACASCQLSGGPNRCSIKQQDGWYPPNLAQNRDSLIKGADGERSPSVKSPKATQKRKSMNNVQGRPAFRDQAEPKRRKTTGTDEPGIAWDGAQQNTQDSQQAARSARAAVNQLISHMTPHPTQMNGSRNNSGLQQLNSDGRPSSGWSTVNQSTPQSIAQAISISKMPPHSIPQADGRPHEAHPQQLSHLASESLRNINRAGPAEDYPLNTDRLVKDDAVPNENAVALIDTFPKPKQRQLYSLISGIQGGIEHLQAQLDSLKNTLGLVEGE